MVLLSDEKTMNREVIYLFFNGFPIANIAALKEVTVKVIYRIIMKTMEQFSKFNDYQFSTLTSLLQETQIAKR